MTLFRKPANWEDGGLVSPKNHLTCVRIQAPFILKGKGVCVLHHFGWIRLSVILQTVSCQARLSMRFPRQEYWSGLPCPAPGDLPDPGIEPTSTASPALQAGSLPTEPPPKPNICYSIYINIIYLKKFRAKKWWTGTLQALASWQKHQKNNQQLSEQILLKLWKTVVPIHHTNIHSRKGHF